MSGMGNGVPADRLIRVAALVSMLLLLLALAFPCPVSAECTVHGNVYDWATFNTINNAVIVVNSEPVQTKVATGGSYSFSLPKGNYMITAKAGTAGTSSEIAAAENISVPDSGDYVIDLILFPPSTFDSLSGFNDTEPTPTMPPDDVPTVSPLPGSTESGQQGWIIYLAGAAILLALLAIVAGFLLLRTLRRPPPPREPARAAGHSTPAQVPETLDMGATEQPIEPVEAEKKDKSPPARAQPGIQELLLPQDCREVLAIIERNGGRVTQLDLRKALPYSEAKVSLIVSDLESRGIIKKIKKGRGNVLIINRPEERSPEK